MARRASKPPHTIWVPAPILLLGQMAAEQLRIPLSSVTVELGDSNLPPAPVAGGSNTTASACSAVMKACEAIRSRLSASAPTSDSRSPGDKSTVGSNTGVGQPSLQESF